MSTINSLPISIVIPVYNVEKYLPDCINALHKQTFTHFEMIFVDDGSTDGSAKIINDYAKKDFRIQYKRLSQRSFGGVARNEGLKIAKGDYVIFLDSDDFFAENLLEVTYQKAIEIEADIVAFDYYEFDDQTKGLIYKKSLRNYLFPTEVEKEVFTYGDVPERILDVVVPVPWNKLFRRSFLLEKGLTFLNTSTTNDVTFAALSLAFAEKIAYIKEALLYYRINLTTSTTSKKTKNMGNIIKAVEAVENHLKSLPDFARYKNSLEYFVVSKYAFSYNAYAKIASKKAFKPYYKHVHKVYNLPDYNHFTPKNEVEEDLFTLYTHVRQTSYPVFAFKQAIKTLIKTTAKSVLRLLGKMGLPFSTYGELKLYYRMKKDGRPLMDALNTTQLREQKIIVSLTSYPGRNVSTALVLKCLEQQTVKPDKILLVLAQDQYPKGKLPAYLQKHRDLAGVDVVFTEDLRSHKKYYHAMSQYPNDIIITFDDDLYIAQNAIERLLASYQKHPKAVNTLYAHRMRFSKQGNPLPYTQWDRNLSAPVDVPSMQILPLTGGGTLYPPHSLNSQAFNKENMKALCFNADDIWVKIMAVIKGTPAVLVKPFDGFRYIEATQEISLWAENRTQNDVQLEKVLRYYNNHFYQNTPFIQQQIIADNGQNLSFVAEA